MSKNDLLEKISSITDKNDKYYFFKNVLMTLNAKDVCSIFDIKLKQDSFKKQLILDKTLKDLNVYLDIRTKSYIVSANVNLDNRKVYLSIYRKMLVLISKTSKYRKNQEYAKFLYRMCPAMPGTWQKKLIQYFLSSNFKSNQRRALEFLNRNWDGDFSNDILRLWMENYYELALKLIVWKMDDKFLSQDVFDSIVDYFRESQDDDYFEYDYSLKILRNKFYSRFYKKSLKEISGLKEKDPISYIFIQKESGHKIDTKFAIRMYNENMNARKYLPRWYSEMGLFGVLASISGDHGFDK